MKTEIIELIGMQGEPEFERNLNDKIDRFKKSSSYRPIEFGHDDTTGLEKAISEQHPEFVEVLKLNPMDIYTTAKDFNSFGGLATQQYTNAEVSIFKDDLKSKLKIVIVSGSTILIIDDPKSCVFNELKGAGLDNDGLFGDVVNIATALKQMVKNSK